MIVYINIILQGRPVKAFPGRDLDIALTKLRIQVDQDQAAYRHHPQLPAITSPRGDSPGQRASTSPGAAGGSLKLPSIIGGGDPRGSSPGRRRAAASPGVAWPDTARAASRGSDSGESADTDTLIGVHVSKVSGGIGVDRGDPLTIEAANRHRFG